MTLEILTPADVAEELRVPERTVIALCARGELRAKKVGRVWRTLRPWVEELRARPSAETLGLRRQPLRQGWVYMIQAGEDGPIKIGFTGCVTSRRATLQTAHWQTLRVLAAFRGSTEDEMAMRVRLNAHRLRGEWFAPAPDVLAAAAELGMATP